MMILGLLRSCIATDDLDQIFAGFSSLQLNTIQEIIVNQKPDGLRKVRDCHANFRQEQLSDFMRVNTKTVH